MVHHAIYYKQNYSYFGIIEALSGAPFDVSFISFDDIKADKDFLKKFFSSRLFVLAAVFIVFFGIILARIFTLQVVNGKSFRKTFL